tara:strand:- start:399 stop:548 length:150 start_codon:yes stop_codon:yes gene_type:complete
MMDEAEFGVDDISEDEYNKLKKEAHMAKKKKAKKKNKKKKKIVKKKKRR